MSFLVDTDICSAHLKGVARVCGRFEQYAGNLSLAVVTLAELYTWVARRDTSPRHRQGLAELLSDVAVLNVDPEIAERFGEVQAALLDTGQPIAGMDLLIAATALVHGLTLVTHNTRHFVAIPGLAVVDWLGP